MRGRHPQDGAVVLDDKVCVAVGVPEAGVGVVVEEDVGDPEVPGLNHHAVHASVLAGVPGQLANMGCCIGKIKL